MDCPFLLESLGSSSLGLCPEHFPSPPSKMKLVLFKLATKSEHHRLKLFGNVLESTTTRASLRLGRLLVSGNFIESVEV